uniref:FBA_2 domain-containing protein n=1 Tax=Panagrellus redivivus TaxID=6233 RepID=A0A7E4V8J0_PANRE
MVQLKHHMLHDIFADLLARPYCLESSVFPGICNFVLSGKGPFHAFRQVVARDVTIMNVTAEYMEVYYRDVYWQNEQQFFNVLFVRWARKVKTRSFEWFNSAREGYLQPLCENSDIESFCIASSDDVKWCDVLKAFPFLVCLKMPLEQFANMLHAAAELKVELTDLNEIVLSDFSPEGNLFDILETWHKYKTHCPNIETMRFDKGYTTKSFEFPESDISFPSVKHLDINVLEVKCIFKLDFAVLTAVQKMFPSLEKVRIEFDSRCKDKPENIERELKELEQFYQTFQALSFGFFLEVVHHEAFHRYHFGKVSDLFSTKGRIEHDGFLLSLHRFKVHSSYPNKSLIYSVRHLRRGGSSQDPLPAGWQESKYRETIRRLKLQTKND